VRATWLFALVLTAALAAPAFAQSPPAGAPKPVRGTVDKLNDHTLAVKSRDGDTVTVTLAPDFTVRTVVPISLTDIKPGDKVGITSIKGTDKARQAIEIHVLPSGLRNLRLSEYPWDLVPESLMTNAEVALVSSPPQGGRIKVTLEGKEEEFAVPSGTPIVAYGKGDPALLKPGTAVFVFARKQPDGSLSAAGVTTEKDGVKPPM
jgi:hypothetical protein